MIPYYGNWTTQRPLNCLSAFNIRTNTLMAAATMLPTGANTRSYTIAAHSLRNNLSITLRSPTRPSSRPSLPQKKGRAVRHSCRITGRNQNEQLFIVRNFNERTHFHGISLFSDFQGLSLALILFPQTLPVTSSNDFFCEEKCATNIELRKMRIFNQQKYKKNIRKEALQKEKMLLSENGTKVGWMEKMDVC